ncbi:MAG: hypothetical protein Q9188_003947 [Gyalolechia gomerana]
MVEMRVTDTVVTSVEVGCTPAVDVEPVPEVDVGCEREVVADDDADVDTEAGGSDEGGITHPADPHAQYDDAVANVDEYVVAGQFDTSLEHDVIRKVDVTNAAEVRRELLCRGVKTGKLLIGTLLGRLLNVADEGTMGPFSRAELKMVLLGAGPRVLWLSISSSTFAQL